MGRKFSSRLSTPQENITLSLDGLLIGPSRPFTDVVSSLTTEGDDRSTYDSRDPSQTAVRKGHLAHQ